MVERAPRSGFLIHSLLVSDRKWKWFQDETKPSTILLRMASKHSLSFACSISWQNSWQDLLSTVVMVAAYRRPALAIGALLAKETSAVFNDESTLLLAGDRIVDPENAGALIDRVCFWCLRSYSWSGSADPFSWCVLRVSMGNVLFLPVLESRDLASTLTVLKSEHDFRICATRRWIRLRGHWRRITFTPARCLSSAMNTTEFLRRHLPSPMFH